nr:glycosyltransferase [Lachnospiraceae bacterium]
MKPFISACIIGKNEEKCIERCLKAISTFGVPIVYTDTGSTDRTLAIASKYTDLIYHFDWCNDFSMARNFCATKSPTDWIWVIDCDEYVTEADLAKLQAFCSDARNLKKAGTISQKDIYTLSGERTYTLTRLGRIYHRNFYHYTGSVHEQITPLFGDNATTAFTGDIYCDLPILMEHDGYADPKVLTQKCERNATLLAVALEEKEDPYLYYQLGKCYTTLGRPDLAAEAFDKGLSFDLDPELYYVQSMVESYGYSLLDLKQYEAALSFEGIYNTFAKSADFVFLMGLIYMNNALFAQAIEEFKKATKYKSCVVDGTNSYRAYYNIGVIYECLGQTKEAIANYYKAGNYAPALKRLEVLVHESV